MDVLEAIRGKRLRSARWWIALAMMLAIAVPALADWNVDWWSVDGGGEIQSMGGGWTLSGSLGQWDGTAHTMSAGGAWQLTGGFWSLAATESDHLFKDGYE